MNLMLGFPETLGLEQGALFPWGSETARACRAAKIQLSV
jgi:hypothetical protein